MTVRKIVFRLAALIVATAVLQAAYLQGTKRQVRLSTAPQTVYIVEGDLVSDIPPRDADKVAGSVRENWEICRYWTGLKIQTSLLPPGNCPLISP